MSPHSQGLSGLCHDSSGGEGWEHLHMVIIFRYRELLVYVVLVQSSNYFCRSALVPLFMFRGETFKHFLLHLKGFPLLTEFLFLF